MCLTNEIGSYNHIVIAFISSKISSELLDSDLIIFANQNLETGLLVDSVIKLYKIVTIPKSLIKRKLGVLSEINNEIVKQKLIQLFEVKS